ncbi:cytochrome c [uncultured Roseobacter sp.]|uniref:c-type cytochrome n=1 Tax=uncultured Roseobacter sp. TaxID=114847 RepID=UPI00262D35F3|nr:cytochrome c [uncultured Roseobacter sp.]
MSSKKQILYVIAIGFFAANGVTAEETPALGQIIPTEELAGLSTTVYPDGEGLPPGSGTVQAGKVVYEDQCSICHGANGEGDMSMYIPILASTGKPDHGFHWSTGHSWPYATSLFEYIRTAMPPFNPKELSDEEIYAVTAYILHMNGFLPEDGEVSQSTLPDIKMPAQDYISSKWEKEESQY